MREVGAVWASGARTPGWWGWEQGACSLGQDRLLRERLHGSLSRMANSPVLFTSRQIFLLESLPTWFLFFLF